MKNNENMCASPDWEAEFHKADAYAKELYMKLRDTEEKAKCLHEEMVIYRTFVKTIEFVLGRKFEG